MKLAPAQLDRACGAVLGSAIGDALGAPYEFDLAAVGPDGPQMIGGGIGNSAPGEWTDDTAMMWCILDVAATGADLRSEGALTQVAQRFRDWFDWRPPDMGNQTRTILAASGEHPTGATMTATSFDLHARTGHTAGNGSLMRTAPVALAYLDDVEGLAVTARRLGALTHYDVRAQESCVLWSLAIRHAILHAELNIRSGLSLLDSDGQSYWAERLDEAESSEPGRFNPNGWAVSALQAAWSAIVHTPVPTDRPPSEHLAGALATAIGIGNDTDTVAAIAGSLLGARWGASAVQAKWRRINHGYPGRTGEQLVELAQLTVNGGQPGAYGWPLAERIDYSGFQHTTERVQHPHDDGVWLTDAAALDDLPDGVSAVVSLCLVGQSQVPADVEHVIFRLIDEPDASFNPNLDFILADAARTVRALRKEGKTVLVHCVAAQSRTTAVAIAYAMLLGQSLGDATTAVKRALPSSRPNIGFRQALERLEVAGFAGG